MMTAIDDLVGRYVAVWSEKDEGARAGMVAELWADDAVHVIESREVHGHEAIGQRITDAYRSLVEEQGFAFDQVGNVGAHHDAVTFEIHMVPAGVDRWHGSGAWSCCSTTTAASAATTSSAGTSPPDAVARPDPPALSAPGLSRLPPLPDGTPPGRGGCRR